jgi:hypothetical protein
MQGVRVEAHSDGLGRAGSSWLFSRCFRPVPQKLRSRPVPSLPRRGRHFVVEDNPDNSESMSMLLEPIGHQVQPAANGMAAPGCCAREPTRRPYWSTLGYWASTVTRWRAGSASNRPSRMSFSLRSLDMAG